MKSKNVLDADSPIERYFEEISRIPRNSGCEKEISDYVADFARERKLEIYQDDLWNVIIKKPASAGCERKDPIILQAHMDMVCAKTAESRHDFTEDAVSLCLENGILHAKDTTLGADDGFGMAFILAILDDDNLSHPPLECVFTVQEEIGMIGAKMVDKSKLTARRMVGLDGDQERKTFVACACSDRVLLNKEYELQDAEGIAVTLELSDFSTGTYQGITHPECGNTIKMTARLLNLLANHNVEYQISDWNAGTAEFTNPFESRVVICIDEKDQDSVNALVNAEFAAILEEFEDERFHGKLQINYEASAEMALSREDSRQLVSIIHLIPNNLFQASVEKKEMRSINNVGVVTMEKGHVYIAMACRSKYASGEQQLVFCCRDIGLLAGFDVKIEERYGPWPYDRESKLRRQACKIMKEEFGYPLEEDVCPGGQEVAYFFSGKEDFDAVLFGADIEFLHTPDERMDMGSFHRMYQLVCKMLETMD